MPLLPPTGRTGMQAQLHRYRRLALRADDPSDRAPEALIESDHLRGVAHAGRIAEAGKDKAAKG